MAGSEAAAPGTKADPVAADGERRDFLKLFTLSSAAVALGAAGLPFIDALRPSRDAQALSRPIIDIAGIAENTALRVVWLGRPVYIRRLTPAQVSANRAVPLATLPDPASYGQRVQPGYDDVAIVIGINTGIACELQGNDPSDPRGPFEGWICPCDGSVYDALGRVRGGPAPKNLAIPPCTFLNDSQVQLG